MLYANLTPAPADSILGLTEAYKKDVNPKKVNLGVGVYMDERGRTPILQAVKKAEKILLDTQDTKTYLPIAGAPEYGQVVQELLFGADSVKKDGGRMRTAHTPGGTGGLRIGAEFLRKVAPKATVWLSSPTWANHKGIFAAAGFKTSDYPYYDPASHGIDFSGLTACLDKIPEGDIVLLHVCCHNPTGVDLSAEQWSEVIRIAQARRWIPFLDFAYQGFGVGVEEDGAILKPLLATGLEFFISSSFSKNFGLYQERVGALTLVAGDTAAVEAAFSHVKATIRVVYSNPSAHGGAIVTTILRDDALRSLWRSELDAMRERIAAVRKDFVGQLHARGASMDFSYIEKQKGMFSFSGLSDAQVQYLRDKKGIYMVAGGRINVAGILPNNIGYLCESVQEALQQAH
ncbi:MAG TPA: aromatic amino acid aminotransferase [Verrucomicrobia bacterium]|nr:MAG: aromatic amino acid aminotransferase [Lentisphaerae bacterium GWF2_57_35]HBA86134.1 aromatic amino acid aminotransferase [Verrucomicrobiota bacterium]